MRRQLFSLIVMVLFNLAAYAQKGNNQVELIAELSSPDKTYNKGWGGFMKGLYGVGNSAQLTLTAGISLFYSEDWREVGGTNVRLVPFLVGYKQNIKKFYVEPQAGFGELGGRIDIGGDWSRQSVPALFGAVAVGYNTKRVDMGVRYQSANGVAGSSAGRWHNKTVNRVGVHIGYYIISCRK